MNTGKSRGCGVGQTLAVRPQGGVSASIAGTNSRFQEEGCSPGKARRDGQVTPSAFSRKQSAASNQAARSITDWVGIIRQAWVRGAANTLSLGRLLSDARARLRYGDWSRLWCSRRLPFSKRKGEMLVTIGQTLGALDAQNSAQLPLAWNAVYYLARLGRPTVERLIAQGRIHPGITLREARALLAEQRPGMMQSTQRSTVKQQLDRLAAFVRETMAAWTDEERRLAHTALLRLAVQVEPGSDARTVTTNQVRFQPAVSGSRSNRTHWETFPSFDIHPKHPQAMP